MRKRLQKIAIVGLLAMATAMPIGVLQGDTAAQQVSKNFTTVAKRAIPTVVSVKIKSPEYRRRGRIYHTPFGSFNDSFLDRFFGSGGYRQGYPDREEAPLIGQASGFLVSSDGYILTNNHVVNGAGQIEVQLNDGREFDARVVGQDPNTDVAVIKINGRDLPYLTLGNSDELEVGEWVVAIGNPLGLQASLTVGVVSAKGRNNLDLANIEDFIQTDAAINQGNSGGPLLNLDGEVVGINTAIASTMGGYMGIGFAIPSAMARHVMEQILDDGAVSRGYIGVILQSVDRDLAQAFGLNKAEGALVAEVQGNSPAERGGIRRGDVIVKYNGTNVQNVPALRSAISLMKPGSEVKITLLRNGQQLIIPVKVSTFPSSFVAASSLQQKLGFEVKELSPEIAQSLGLFGEEGVVVSEVAPGSPAAWTGMKKGALIVEVNQKRVTSPDLFRRILEETPPGRPILLLMKQEGQMRYISLKIG